MPQTNAPLLPPAAEQVKPQVKQATNAKQPQVKQATNANPPQQVKPPKTEKELRMETINSHKKEYRERCEKMGDKCVAVQDCKKFGFGSEDWPVTKYRFDKNDEADQKLKAKIEKEHGENAVKDGNKCVSNSMWKDALFAKQMMEIGLLAPLPPQSPQQTQFLTNAAASANTNKANAAAAAKSAAAPSANAAKPANATAKNAAAPSANAANTAKPANATAKPANATATANANANATAKNVKPSANSKKPVAV